MVLECSGAGVRRLTYDAGDDNEPGWGPGSR